MDSTSAVSAAPSTSKVEAPSASNPTTAGAVASSNANVTMGTTLNSLNELKQKAPELYQQMMKGIAMSVCNDMKHHQDRLKRLMREASH